MILCSGVAKEGVEGGSCLPLEKVITPPPLSEALYSDPPDYLRHCSLPSHHKSTHIFYLSLPNIYPIWKIKKLAGYKLNILKEERGKINPRPLFITNFGSCSTV